MALPSFGQISFSDFNATYGIAFNQEISIYTAALLYSVPINIDGFNPISMDEFYGLDQPYYDIYERCDGAFGNQRYSVFHAIGNQFTGTVNSTCCYKIATNVPYSDMQTSYPSVLFMGDILNDGCFCSGGEPL